MTNKFPTVQAWLTHAVNKETVDIQDLLLLVVSKVDADDIQDAFQSLMDEDGYFEDENNDSEEEIESKFIVIAGHRIEYWYNDDFDGEIQDDNEDPDFDHIKHLVINGCVEGELCTSNWEEEHRGWWKKV